MNNINNKRNVQLYVCANIIMTTPILVIVLQTFENLKCFMLASVQIYYNFYFEKNSLKSKNNLSFFILIYFNFYFKKVFQTERKKNVKNKTKIKQNKINP